MPDKPSAATKLDRFFFYPVGGKLVCSHCRASKFGGMHEKDCPQAHLLLPLKIIAEHIDALEARLAPKKKPLTLEGDPPGLERSHPVEAGLRDATPESKLFATPVRDMKLEEERRVSEGSCCDCGGKLLSVIEDSVPMRWCQPCNLLFWTGKVVAPDQDGWRG